jgi:lipid-A-disaccharide synthase
MTAAPLKIAIVAGEESGDLLGADIIHALRKATGREIELVGIGGRHLQALGLTPLFDGSDIALMGVTAILRDLPRLYKRIGQTAQMIVAEKPDCLITIDSPDFALRVTKKGPCCRSGHPDCPLRLPERVGVAAGQGTRHAAACRSCAVHPAFRNCRT